MLPVGLGARFTRHQVLIDQVLDKDMQYSGSTDTFHNYAVRAELVLCLSCRWWGCFPFRGRSEEA